MKFETATGNDLWVNKRKKKRINMDELFGGNVFIFNDFYAHFIFVYKLV